MTTATRQTNRAMARPTKEPDPSSYLGRVALRLKNLRVAAGLDHAAGALRITAAGYDVSESTIYRWEQGRTQPHLEAIPAIAKAYGVSIRVVLPNS